MAIASVGSSVPVGVGVRIDAGSGSPEGIVAGAVGALWLQTDGSNGEVLWRKTSGTGNTGWTSYGTFSGLLTALAGLAIGADTNLYRSAANVLKTDDNFVVALDIEAAGGFRQTHDGWNQDNVTANQTNVEITRSVGRFRAARAGSVTGVVVNATEARTAGTLTIKVFKNTGLAGATGTQLGTLTAVLDGTNTNKKATTQAKDVDTFAAGDELYLTITTDSGWLPTTSDIRAALEIED